MCFGHVKSGNTLRCECTRKGVCALQVCLAGQHIEMCVYTSDVMFCGRVQQENTMAVCVY